MPPRYRYPFRITASILGSFLLGGRRSLAKDAPRLMRGVGRFSFQGDVPSGGGPYLFLVNHYSAPGFKAWWLAVGLTAAVGRELHWPMTSAWTFPDAFRARFLTPITEWVLGRLARMYGFTLMPPMPPRERDVEARAAAVREILRRTRTDKPWMALAPEGMDTPGGRLTLPPPGAGRFIAHISASGYIPIPVGAFEVGDTFVIRFGEPFSLNPTYATVGARQRRAPTTASVSVPHVEAPSAARDLETGKIVMEKIAALTPFPSPGLPPLHEGRCRERGEG